MAWWGQDLSINSFQPKQKNRFVVRFGNGGLLLSLSSVTKPSVSIESKQYRMINHVYNYPGIAKWEPVTLKFVDGQIWGDSAVSADPGDDLSQSEKTTSHVLWKMLLDSGYLTPDLIPLPAQQDRNPSERSDRIRAYNLSTPEKASTISNSFGEGDFWIYQLSPEGRDEDGNISATEAWQMSNPIITKISWGDLDYGDDGLVEYTLEVTYDWARHYNYNPNAPGSAANAAPT